MSDTKFYGYFVIALFFTAVIFFIPFPFNLAVGFAILLTILLMINDQVRDLKEFLKNKDQHL
jgi:flagellar biosynthesis protein FliR